MLMNTKNYFFPKVLLLLTFTKLSTMSFTSDYFSINGNLTKITWSHACNSKAKLGEALNNSNIMMIEADVIYGSLNSTNTSDPMPVMGHPPQNTSDISLQEYLIDFENFIASANSSRKGLKLDFKSLEAFNHSLPLLKNISKVFPLWINADILVGPGNSSTMPVNASEFLRLAAELNSNSSVLSIGWTTNGPEEIYTSDHIKNMTDIIESCNVTQEITFPVRAANTANSLTQMETLLKGKQNSTLTIWSSNENDKVNITALRNLIFKIGINKIYLDVPESILNELHLDAKEDNSNNNNNIGGGVTTMKNSFLLTLIIFLATAFSNFI